jgi:uncharacterized protein
MTLRSPNQSAKTELTDRRSFLIQSNFLIAKARADMNPLQHYNRPWLFYGLCTAIPWAFWLPTAWMSHQPAGSTQWARPGALLAILGVLAPTVVAACLIFPNPALRQDCVQRLTRLGGISIRYWLLAGLVMPASTLLAIALSLPLGFSATQFQVTGQASFSAGGMSPWFVLIAFAVIEELAWHSYGTDALRRLHSLFATCVIFSLFWAVWHAPLMLIKGYYHSNLAETGLAETLNFPVSIFAVVFLMNWLYYRAGRCIWIAALFHVTSGLFNELFPMHPRTKLIQTGLLLAIAVFVVHRERRLFFSR